MQTKHTSPSPPLPQAPRGPNPHAPASADERRAVARAYWVGYVWRKVLLSLCVLGAALWVVDEGGSFDALFGLILSGFTVINGLALLSRVMSEPHEGEGAEHPKVREARKSLKLTLTVFGVAFVLSARLLGGLLVEMSEPVGRAEGAEDLSLSQGRAHYHLINTLNVRQDLMFDTRQEARGGALSGGASVEVTLTAAVGVEAGRADHRQLFLVAQEAQRVKGDAPLSDAERAPVLTRLVERARKSLALRPSLKEQCFSVVPSASEGEYMSLVRKSKAVMEGAPVTFLQRELSQHCMKNAFGSLFIFLTLSLSFEVALLLGLIKQRLTLNAARRLHPRA